MWSKHNVLALFLVVEEMTGSEKRQDSGEDSGPVWLSLS